MDLAAALVEGLTQLSDALEDPVTDLGAILSVLTDDLNSAVPQYLGLTIRLHIDAQPVVVSTFNDSLNGGARSSLTLHLLPFGPTATTGSIAFFSGANGAFVDLADDARWIFNLDGPPVLDGHLPARGSGHEPVGIRGLDALTAINQAVGVLIAQGHTPQEARDVLSRRSRRDGQSLPDTARQILDQLTPPEPDDED